MSEIVTIGDATLYHGDCMEILPTLDKVDAVVTDPPYGLGFMGKGWDHGVPGVLYWQAVLAAMKPGAHLLAFGGTRTYHRLMVAIEDAGFEIRDCIMWVYGSGFPKSMDVGKAIDKAAGAKREVLATVRTKGGGTEHINKTNSAKHGYRPGEYQKGMNVLDITAPATDAAKDWDGWGTALKPAWEPIIVARKPLTGTVAANVQEHGTGALNIDASRIEHVTVDGGNLAANSHLRKHINGGNGGKIISHEANRRVVTPNMDGRWPANLIHDGSEEVVSLFPSSKARFFYCAKASRTDRGNENNHPTVKPTDLMRYLVRLVTPPGGVVLDPFMGSGSTGKAAVLEGFRFIGIEKDTEHGYMDIAAGRIEAAQNQEQLFG